ncbi:MAG TPA: DUF2726 domain-containing protein [Nitrospira sp.]|nr:DUF2726 domain-containing protein [Nitrospira sp.]
MEAVLIIAAVVLTALWWFLPVFHKKPEAPEAFYLPPNTIVTSDTVFTETELSLYNLLQMAVQDRYLILAQIPLWSCVSVETPEKARSKLLNHLALKRADFALIHPGTRHVEQVVQIDDASLDPSAVERQRVIESILDAAGIKLVLVRSKKSYTIPELTALLGLEADE